MDKKTKRKKNHHIGIAQEISFYLKINTEGDQIHLKLLYVGTKMYQKNLFHLQV